MSDHQIREHGRILASLVAAGRMPVDPPGCFTVGGPRSDDAFRDYQLMRIADALEQLRGLDGAICGGFERLRNQMDLSDHRAEVCEPRVVGLQEHVERLVEAAATTLARLDRCLDYDELVSCGDRPTFHTTELRDALKPWKREIIDEMGRDEDAVTAEDLEEGFGPPSKP